MTPITSKPAGNQQNQQHLYENFGVSDDYESLDMEKIETSTYERLQVQNKDMNSENETSVPNALKNDKENNKYAKDHRVEGIITVLLHLISLQLIGNNIVSLHNQTVIKLKNRLVGWISIQFSNNQLIDLTAELGT